MGSSSVAERLCIEAEALLAVAKVESAMFTALWTAPYFLCHVNKFIFLTVFLWVLGSHIEKTYSKCCKVYLTVIKL